MIRVIASAHGVDDVEELWGWEIELNIHIASEDVYRCVHKAEDGIFIIDEQFDFKNRSLSNLPANIFHLIAVVALISCSHSQHSSRIHISSLQLNSTNSITAKCSWRVTYRILKDWKLMTYETIQTKKKLIEFEKLHIESRIASML